MCDQCIQKQPLKTSQDYNKDTVIFTQQLIFEYNLKFSVCYYKDLRQLAMLLSFHKLITRPLFLFCIQNKKQSLRITREVLTKYKQMQPWRNIRMLYSITMAHQDLALPPQNLEVREDRILINQVLDSLSNVLHEVPHREINILLDVLKQQGIKYDRDRPIYRALNKQAKLLFGRDMKPELLPRSLQYLRVLGFPKFTINKLLDELAKTAAKSTQNIKEQTVMKTSTMLQLTIFCMEQPFVTFPILTKWLKIVVNTPANSLSALCYLYQLVKITEKCLHRKIQYQFQKTNARDLLFNPYDELEQIIQQQTKKQSKKPKKIKQEEEEQFEEIEVKQQLTVMSQQAIKIMNDALDINNLKKSIVKAVEDNIEPFNKELVLYTCDIAQLKNVVQQFVKTNIGSLTPVELIYLLKRCSKQKVDPTITEYLQVLGKHMSVQQKVYLYIESHQTFDRQVGKQQIFDLLDQIEKISYSEFVAITKLTQLLPKKQQKYIKEVLQRIKSKMQVASGSSKSQKETI